MGRQSRANAWIQSSTRRPIRRTKKTRTTRPEQADDQLHGSALVEQASRVRRLLVLGRHLDVRRREQEHLVRDPLDRAVQPEHQAGGEVHQALGVGVAPCR